MISLIACEVASDNSEKTTNNILKLEIAINDNFSQSIFLRLTGK
jgi:hypothetical protein